MSVRFIDCSYHLLISITIFLFSFLLLFCLLVVFCILCCCFLPKLLFDFLFCLYSFWNSATTTKNCKIIFMKSISNDKLYMRLNVLSCSIFIHVLYSMVVERYYKIHILEKVLKHIFFVAAVDVVVVIVAVALVMMLISMEWNKHYIYNINVSIISECYLYGLGLWCA